MRCRRPFVCVAFVKANELQIQRFYPLSESQLVYNVMEVDTGLPNVYSCRLYLFIRLDRVPPFELRFVRGPLRRICSCRFLQK